MKKDTTTKNEELNGSNFNSGKCKCLEAFNKFCDSVNACVNSGGITNVDLIAKEQVEKELKALEIIKRTAMKLVSIQDSESGICTNGRYAIYDNEYYESVDLTKEEYDLLKEIL